MSNQHLTKMLEKKYIDEIDHWIAKFPKEQKQSACLQALRIAQDALGWLAEDTIKAVADYLEMPAIAVFEVATFYSMYNLEPVGKYKIKVCNSLSCSLCGSASILDHFKKRLNVDLDETTADGKFTLKTTECLGACVNAPACYIGRDYYENLTAEKVDQILQELGS